MINLNPQTLGRAQAAYDAVVIDDLHASILSSEADYLVMDTQAVTVIRHGRAPSIRNVAADKAHSALLEVLGRLMPETKSPYLVSLPRLEAIRGRLPFVSEKNPDHHF